MEPHVIPVASRDEIERGWEGLADGSTEIEGYFVPLDPAEANVCEACE